MVAVAFEPVELDRHRGSPHPLKDLHGVVGELGARGFLGCFATWSNTRPSSFFEALRYALAYLLVTSARDDIDNPLLMPHHAHRFAGKPR